MQEFNSLDDILDFAIKEEQMAADFYTTLAAKMEQQEMKDVFEQFSLEEIGHRIKLEAIKSGKKISYPKDKIVDLKIGDYLVDVDTTRTDISYQEALIIAMKKEKAAYQLYTNLAAIASDDATRDVFLMLAKEEAKHKVRFEIEYDNNILTEN